MEYYLFYFADRLNPSLVQDLCRELHETPLVPSGTPLIGGKCEPHEADWELIQLEFDADGVADILGNDTLPGWVSYSHHFVVGAYRNALAHCPLTPPTSPAARRGMDRLQETVKRGRAGGQQPLPDLWVDCQVAMAFRGHH